MTCRRDAVVRSGSTGGGLLDLAVSPEFVVEVAATEGKG